MLKNFRRKSLQKRITSYVSERDLSGVNSKIRTLGFIVDEGLFSDFEVLFGYAKTLGLQPKNVKVFSYIESKKKLPTLRQNQVYNKDFNWKGELQNANAIDFLNQEFSVLVGYYSGTHEFLDLLVAGSKAQFKVGFSQADERLYDLLVGVSEKDPAALAIELKKYLTILNKL